MSHPSKETTDTHRETLDQVSLQRIKARSITKHAKPRLFNWWSAGWMWPTLQSSLPDEIFKRKENIILFKNSLSLKKAHHRNQDASHMQPPLRYTNPMELGPVGLQGLQSVLF